MGPDRAKHDHEAFEQDLQAAASGDAQARRRLWENHYDLFHQCAKAWLKKHWAGAEEAPRVSLVGTEIVNAAFERLVDRIPALANGRSFFFKAFYTECMRIVIDHYRRTRDHKGRGAMRRQELESQFVQKERLSADFDTIHDALAELERKDHRMGQIAMLKVLESRPVSGKSGAMRGLTNEEVAELLGIGLRTVEKDWAFAKAFLHRRLGTKKQD
jgi:RNA polymerase sigma-70 factor (ECF subfamily)